MDRFPPLRLLLEPGCSRQIPPDALHLPVIDGRSGQWESAAAALGDSGRNFVIALPDPGRDVPRLCEIVHAEHCVPERLQKWSAYALRSALFPEDFQIIRAGVETGDPWFLVEHLKLLPRRRPDHGRYLIYCELLGVVAQFSELEPAKRALARYYAAFPSAAMYPLAGIYEWTDGHWTRTRIFY